MAKFAFRLPRWTRIFKSLGPGFITGASDDDPSGIATYSQTGAVFGYGQIWAALWSFPLQAIIQEMCGRIGLVTGKGLAGALRKSSPGPILWFAVALLTVANAFNIGADLGAMASAIRLLVPVDFLPLLFALTFGTVLLQIIIPYHTYSKYLKFLAFSLFAYVITVFLTPQNWGQLFWATLIPQFQFNTIYIMNIVAVLGTTISPYLFFWQSSEEVEEAIVNGKLKAMGQGQPKITLRDVKIMRRDTGMGMLFSNMIMFFIIATTAGTLHGGVTDIQTAQQAALALRPLAGEFAFLLFTTGIIGTGLLAVPILAGAVGYAVAETFRWRAGLSRKFFQAPHFYVVIALVTILGAGVNFLPIPSFRLLYYSAVLNGLCAPPLMFLILKLGNNEKLLGKRTNPWWSNLGGALATLAMTAAAGLLIWQLITGG